MILFNKRSKSRRPEVLIQNAAKFHRDYIKRMYGGIISLYWSKKVPVLKNI